MALRPGPGAGGAGGAASGAAAAAGAASFMFPVGGGLGPPQGMIPMQQQGFPMVPVVQSNMPGMMGMNYGSQMPPGPMAMQGGMALGPLPAAGMPYMGQAPFLGMRPAAPQYSPDMQKQFAEEQQKRFEHQQKFLEEERKRRQFEEQKQKLRLLSSVKPKAGEKSRDDALEAIKGNLDGFSRDAKMHPTPAAHPKKPDHSTPSHSAVSVSHSAFLGDEEFSDFIQGPVDPPRVVPQPSSQPFRSATEAGQLLSEQAVVQPLPPAQAPVIPTLHGTAGQVPYFPTSAASPHSHAPGVGVFPAQDPIQQMMPAWIYNDSLVPELYKKILETTLTPAGIDTAKLYPILMSSGLPRETLGQIWALANRTTPGKLTKEELYAVLAMIAVTQRGIPAVSPDVLNQFPAAPVPTLSGFPMPLPAPVSQQPLLPSAPPGPMPLMGMSIAAPGGTAAAQPAGGFLPPYPPGQVVKAEEDDFQEFQDASKSGSLDDSFPDFQGDVAGSSKAASSQQRSSVPPLLVPLPGSKALSTPDKYAVFKGIAAEKPSESTAPFGDAGDRYSAFRELEQPPEPKPLGDNLAEPKAAGADDGFTDFKTADSVSPLEPPAKDKAFPAPFPPLPLQSKQPTPAKAPLNLADLDLFASPAESKQPSFPPALPAPKSGSLPPALPAAAAQPAPSKSSGLADDFGEFNLFGEFSPCTAGSGQDDFADFMAFNSSSGFSEQKADDKFNALRLEPAPAPQPASAGSTGRGGQGSATAATPTKYDIFKQLSLEGSGAGFEEAKDSTPLSSVKSDDDFADFHSSKFSSACTSLDKSLGDKVAAFKQAKEDSASVKSLDLPSIGGSSVGKEDSEDALSVQFDMKLADVGGDLKHVMSDSSLDLPTVSGQHPPAADIDDLKCAPFGSCNSGSAVSSLASYDWSDKEDIQQGKKLSSLVQPSGSGSSAATSVLQKKETLFGSSENITMTTVSKVTTFASEDALQDVSFAAFANFKDPAPAGPSQDDSGGFGDFASPAAAQEAAAHARQEADFLPCGLSSELQRESTDDFGEFQSEKPKISKFDFLVATSQGKVKSSEEMIRSELATFDLSVQGSHKRSLSLGDRELSRSSPLPALEQPFRDRSNTLSEKPALPVIRDKYKDLTGEVEESERYAYEWQRCLESALQVIKKANDTLNGISSSSVCTEVIQSAQGMEYLLGVVEVYRVTKRVELGIKATAVCSEKLQQLLKDIDRVWNNLISFMSLAALTPDENSLDFSSCMLRPGIKNAQELACGVCLLNVDSRSRNEEKPVEELPSKAFNSETDNFKLAYGGHQYHASCANFWINCVEPKPPGLILPDLL
ncbi:synergin gamma isoform X3 [Melanerpes formicivorus]|uniref:synergin gamma isoform X3 n=1 Tax=Melanerpes formicivorus TaxID=211600 RepID=UPI00358F30A0